MKPGIEDIADKVYHGERLSFDDGVRLFHHPNIVEIAALADYVRWRKHPEPVVTYIIGRNINYTNVCWVRCSFCNFYLCSRPQSGLCADTRRSLPEDPRNGGRERRRDSHAGRPEPKLKIEWYEELLRDIMARFPGVILHAFSPARADLHQEHLETVDGEDADAAESRRAALRSGGGAEILTDRVRQHISPYKDTAEEWLDCMRVAHHVGLPTTATMMYGSVDTIEDRVEHLIKLRDLQDETGGFKAFIAWNYQPDGTELGGERASAYDYLRTIAVARVMLDNFENLQASWVTQGAAHRSDLAALRRQRLRLHDDGRERRLAGRMRLHRAHRGDRAVDHRCRIHAESAKHAV